MSGQERRVLCPSCSARCRVDDAACGACGNALARLQVIDARRRIDASTTTVVVEIENSGVVAAAAVLRRIDARTFPSWLIAGPTLDEAIVLPPKSRVAVRFDLDPTKLPAPGHASPGNPGRFVVPLVTSLVRFDADRGRAIRRVLAVELAISGRATVSPTNAVVPFLSLQRLHEGFTHAVRIDNDGGHGLGIDAVVLDVVGPITAVLSSDLDGRVVGAGEGCDVAITVGAGAGIDEAIGSGPVAASVWARFSFVDGTTRIISLSLTIGRGPEVVVVDNAVIHTRGRARRAQVVVENPGQRAVRVQPLLLSAEIDDGPWLTLVDDRLVILEPGQKHAIELLVEPEHRFEEALEQPWGERRLRLQHDGWQKEEAQRVVDVVITAELGRTRTLDEATLGVDFGTSNSSVSMFHGPTGTLHALPLDRASGREALASLLFFTGDRSSGSVDGFLFGAAAENAAPQNFTNLVRQLKSVVARAPETEWNFVDDVDSHARVTRKTTPELLARFFTELKRRAEDGLRALPLPFLAELDLVDMGVRFRHAVFSHPVGVDDVMLHALHDAAITSGLNAMDFETFKRERCVDEALAAVLAWVYLAASLPEAEVPLVDEERLLCFDAGGGTCDVAAVVIKDLAAFRRRPGQGAVDVELLANGGDPRFGGTDVDRLLASWLLDEFSSRTEMQDVDIDGLRRALFYPSYEAWRRARGDIDTDGTTARSRAIFHKSSDLLRAAERIKKTLSESPSASFVASVDEWPKRSSSSSSSLAGTRGARVELTVGRDRFEAVCRIAFEGAAALVDPVIDAAGWRADDVTTVLFTGQTSKIPALRRAVIARLLARRQPSTPPPVLIEPGRVAAFDVKRCVAQGASILGDSRRGGGGWLRVTRRSQTALSAPLQVRRGPLLVDVVGLEAGRALPASGVVMLGEPTTRLVLYRTNQPAFELRWTTPVTEVAVVVESEGLIVAVIDDEHVTARRIA